MATPSLDVVLTMNALVSHEFLQRATSNDGELPASDDGEQRYIWESRFGPILIEIVGGSIFVNGSQVEQLIRNGTPGDGLEA